MRGGVSLFRLPFSSFSRSICISYTSTDIISIRKAPGLVAGSMTRALCGSHQRCASRGPVGGAVTCPLLLLLKILVFVMYISPSPRSVHASHHQPAMNVAAVIGAPFIGRRSGETCPGRRAPGTVCPPSSRLVLAWGGGWEFDDDVWERLGTRILNFVLRRKEPEEPHPLRMQRWTISMRRFPFFRLVVRHMQFYVDGRCEVEEEVHSPPLFPKRRKKAGQSTLPSAIRAGKGESAKSRKLRKRRPHVKEAKIAEEPPTLQGKWKYDKYGLNWELEEGGLRYFYHAELIWHSFGDRPKMHCGVVVRNRGPESPLPPWLLRPVVGTFSGLGNGTDTCLMPESQGSKDNRFRDY